MSSVWLLQIYRCSTYCRFLTQYSFTYLTDWTLIELGVEIFTARTTFANLFCREGSHIIWSGHWINYRWKSPNGDFSERSLRGKESADMCPFCLFLFFLPPHNGWSADSHPERITLRITKGKLEDAWVLKWYHGLLFQLWTTYHQTSFTCEPNKPYLCIRPLLLGFFVLGSLTNP